MNYMIYFANEFSALKQLHNRSLTALLLLDTPYDT